jgi:6-phospho-beta-glucosidase
MKVAVVGGGGFRTPLVWAALAGVSNGSFVEELALQDPNELRLARIAGVIEGLRRERGGGPAVRTSKNLAEVVEGAGAVLCAIRVGGLEARVVDETVPLAEGVLGQETIGPGGICMALRTLPVMLGIAAVVSDRAPSAWLLNFTNPAGLITEALRNVMGDRVVGICDTPAALCARVASALGKQPENLSFDYAGLNHLGWLLAVKEGSHDLLPGLLDDPSLGGLEEGRLFGRERLRQLGMLPNEYLLYYEAPDAIIDAFRRVGATRAQVLLAQQAGFYSAGVEKPHEALESWRRARDARHGTYMAEAWSAAGGEPAKPASCAEDAYPATQHTAAQEDRDLLEAGYASVAARFLRALSTNAGETLALDVANNGRLPFLDDDAVVEVPCEVTSSGPQSRVVGTLPPAQAELVARVKEVERTTIRASLEGSRSLAAQALAAHPVVPSREAGERILAGYLAALPELGQHVV